MPFFRVLASDFLPFFGHFVTQFHTFSYWRLRSFLLDLRHVENVSKHIKSIENPGQLGAKIADVVKIARTLPSRIGFDLALFFRKRFHSIQQVQLERRTLETDAQWFET